MQTTVHVCLKGDRFNIRSEMYFKCNWNSQLETFDTKQEENCTKSYIQHSIQRPVVSKWFSGVPCLFSKLNLVSKMSIWCLYEKKNCRWLPRGLLTSYPPWYVHYGLKVNFLLSPSWRGSNSSKVLTYKINLCEEYSFSCWTFRSHGKVCEITSASVFKIERSTLRYCNCIRINSGFHIYNFCCEFKHSTCQARHISFAKFKKSKKQQLWLCMFMYFYFLPSKLDICSQYKFSRGKSSEWESWCLGGVTPACIHL